MSQFEVVTTEGDIEVWCRLDSISITKHPDVENYGFWVNGTGRGMITEDEAWRIRGYMMKEDEQ